MAAGGALRPGLCGASPPVTWGIGVLGYAAVARAIAPRLRIVLAAGSMGAILSLGLLFPEQFHYRFSAGLALGATGVDQLWVFGDRYLPLAAAVFVIWIFTFARLIEARGLRRTLMDWRLHLWVLNTPVSR
jgi:hypothetical protein